VSKEKTVAQKMSTASRMSRLRKVPSLDVGEPRIPRYLQVASILRHRIDNRTWTVGDQIQTIDELEREFGVARVTVRQAIELLREEGLLQSQQGRGTFVVKTIERDRWLSLGTDWTSLLAPIKGNVPHALPHNGIAAAPKLEPDDGEAAGSYVFLNSLQKRDGAPYALARVHVAKQVFDRAPEAFGTRVALAVIRSMKNLAIARAWQTLEVAAADPETARLLNLPLNAPIAKARVIVTGRENVVLYVGEITYRGDCVRIRIELNDARQ
jgi:GntR family transcriptional regulator